MITGHGNDRYRYQKQLRADFSSNSWFGGTPPELISHLQQNMHLIGNYPEPDAAGLCLLIAQSHSVNSNQVLAFNGSVEAFYTIALAFRESGSAILYPAFSEYEDACRMHQHIPLFFTKDEWKSVLKSGTDLFWIGNPNNPDGHVFNISMIDEALKTYPNTIFVVDESYAAFISGFQSAISLTQKYSNLIVVRSLTKCYSIPGLRLGYVVASEKLANCLRKFQQPWSVNALAQQAGKFLIGDFKQYPFNTIEISTLSFDLQLAIGQLDGFQVIPSKMPFFLVKMQWGTASGLKEFLIEEYGILIRDASNFRGLNDLYFRVCSQDKKNNELLILGLTNWNLNR